MIDACDFSRQILPANLFAEVAAAVKPVGVDGREWQHNRRNQNSTNRDHCDGYDGDDARTYWVQSREPLFFPNGTTGEQHRICGRRVIAATLGYDEEYEWNDEHPGNHAEGFALRAEVINESNDPERNGEGVCGNP